MTIVRNIKIRQDITNGNWYATCYSNRLGDIIQWGKTDIEASRNLQEFVAVQGDEWPEVEHAES